MSLWRQLNRGLRALRNRGAADQEIADEVNHYLEEATAALAARGLSPAEARRILADQPLSVPLTEIGEMVSECGLWQREGDGEKRPLKPRGWEHEFD